MLTSEGQGCDNIQFLSVSQISQNRGDGASKHVVAQVPIEYQIIYKINYNEDSTLKGYHK